MSKFCLKVIGVVAAFCNIANARLTGTDEIIEMDATSSDFRLDKSVYKDYVENGIISHATVARGCLIVGAENPYSEFVDPDSNFSLEEEVELANEILEQVTDSPLEYCLLLSGKNHMIDPL